MNEARLRTVLMVVAVYHLLLGALMIFAPGAFYDSLGKFPPKNEHYIKDVSTFYIAMGVVVFISVRRRSWRVPVLVFITLEYAIHTLNHLVDVGKAATDFTGWFDFFALAAATVILAAITTVAWRIRPDAEPEPDEEPAL
jgi:hypothetical protein